MSTGICRSAAAKLILCGEHAVVYGRPALALPLRALRATAEAQVLPPGSGLVIDAPDLGRRWRIGDAPDEPLSQLALSVLARLGAAVPDVCITITSEIPIASGLGSGAAIASALARALATVVAADLEPAQLSALVYESERHFHGTPSGIDNSVVAYERPIWYQRNPVGAPTIDLLRVGHTISLLIADTGLRSPTRLPVAEVRRRWQQNPAHYEQLFDQSAALVTAARSALAAGDLAALGSCLDQSQALLEQLGVSSPELDRLVAAARAAGALGAKLSGAGWGGVMLALINPDDEQRIASALSAAGAVRVLLNELPAGS